MLSLKNVRRTLESKFKGAERERVSSYDSYFQDVTFGVDKGKQERD